MKIAYQAENLFDAHLVRHALEQAGLPAFVLGESLLGGGGELPLFGVLRVGVPDECLPVAVAVVAALDLGTPAAAPSWDSDDNPGLAPA